MNIPFEKHPMGKGFRAKMPTKSNKFELSIVAGSFFYSTPRKDLQDTSEYSAVEVAIFDNNGAWASVKDMTEAGVFNILDEGEHDLEDMSGNPSNGVWGWVPVDKIKQLVENI